MYKLEQSLNTENGGKTITRKMRIQVDKNRVISKNSFQMCGLCSEKSDSFVDVTMELRVFLRTFLSPPNPDYDLPYKVCLKCYKTTTDAKGFKDRSNTSMMKLLKEGRRDLFSKDRRRPKILVDWKDKHMAEKMNNRIERQDRQESEEIPMVDTNADKIEVVNDAPSNESTTLNERRSSMEETKVKDCQALGTNGPVLTQTSTVVTEENIPQSTDNQNEINNQFSDAMEIMETAMETDKNSSLIEEEETFPATGPYQCELCDVICETKEDFLNDIKTKHVNEIDADVLDALEKDIKIRAAKRRAGLIS